MNNKKQKGQNWREKAQVFLLWPNERYKSRELFQLSPATALQSVKSHLGTST
jgi:hypothetical protein